MSNYSKNPLAQLKAIHPSLTDEDFMTHIELRDDGDGEVYVGRWDHPTLTQPTEQQLADTKAAAEQAIADEATRAATRTALRASWDTLPAYIRGPYMSMFISANDLLDQNTSNGDEAAVEMIDSAVETPKILANANGEQAVFNSTKATFKAAIEAI